VEYIGVRATTLRKDDGEIILIPNSEMYSSVVTIRGAGDRLRMTLKLKIGFDQNPELTKQCALDGLDAVAGIVDSPAPTALVTEFAPSGVSITVTFWIDTNERKPQEIYDQAAIAILAAIRKAGLELFPPEELVLEKPVEIIDERKKKKDALD
jgi:small-conductance mechanosensitive channel